MNHAAPIFNTKEHMCFAQRKSAARKKALLIPLQLILVVVSGLCFAAAVVIDYEIYFRIFEYLAGEDYAAGEGGYWSPALMACTGGIMILAFHLLAERHPRHPMVRVVSWLAGLIIMAFIIGGGLYIAAMLYNDGLGEISAEITPIVLGALPGAEGEDWIDLLFNKVTSPFAVFALSLGIGGLSIVTIFIAHHLLSFIMYAVREIYTRSANLRKVLALHGRIKRAEEELAEIEGRVHELAFHDEAYLRMQIADDTLEVVSEHLMAHEQALQEWEFGEREHRWEWNNDEEAKRALAAVKKIRAITLEDILQHLSMPKQLRSSS